MYELKVAQKKAKFKEDQAMKKACFQINQVERQKRFQCEQDHLCEVSAVEEQAKFQVEITQRRLQHRKQVEESQQSFANHIEAVGKMVGKAMPPIILQLMLVCTPLRV